MNVVDLFAGPGGWDIGARALGIDTIGIELDKWACATRVAAELPTIQANVSQYDPSRFDPCAGLIASPPCTAFSTAGKGHGRQHRDQLTEAVAGCDWTARPDPDPAVWLVLEVGRWADPLRPAWIACEQVPAVLPIWQAYADLFTTWGYSTWCGTLSAERYGVPQTRKRAVLIASREHIVSPPAATHQRYNSRADDGGRTGPLLPWVSMAEALGWKGAELNTGRDWKKGGTRADAQKIGCEDPAPTVTAKAPGQWQVSFPRRDDRGDSADGYRERDWRHGDQPAFAVTEKARSWTVRGDNRENATERRIDAPAPTVCGGHSAGALRIVERQPGLVDQHVAADVAERKPWANQRPATSIIGRSLVADPGANANRFNGATKSRNDGIRVSVADALVLQSFPPDYPVQGSNTEKFRQIGNAIPPLLAQRVLERLVGAVASEPETVPEPGQLTFEAVA